MGVWFRHRNQSGGTPGGSWYVNGQEIDTISGDGTTERITPSAPSWRDLANDPFNGSGYTGGDLDPADNPHTLEWDGDGTGAGEYHVDVVALVDNRYTHFFDDSVTTINGDNYLDGPELYPSSATVTTIDKQTSFNLASGDLTSTWNDTSNNQQIELSNDGGATYPLSANNSTSVSGDFPDAGRTAKVRFALGRTNDTRTDATPLQGYVGQEIDLFDFNGDLSTEIVIDELELSRSHFENLQTLHNYGDYVWTIQHDSGDISNLVVESFSKGDQTQPKPDGFDLQENKSSEIEASTYYNSIYLEGALQDDGTRPTAESKSDTAINEDNREISPGVLRDPNITTEAGAQFRANAILTKALQENAQKGQVTVAPSFAHPGYSYPVDFGEGEQNYTAEEVNLTISNNNVSATYDFVDRSDLSDEIRRLKQNAKEIGNRV